MFIPDGNVPHPDILLMRTKMIIGELAEALGERRAVLALIDTLGNDALDPPLPEGTDPTLQKIRDLLIANTTPESDPTEIGNKARALIDQASVLLFGTTKNA